MRFVAFCVFGMASRCQRRRHSHSHPSIILCSLIGWGRIKKGSKIELDYDMTGLPPAAGAAGAPAS